MNGVTPETDPILQHAIDVLNEAYQADPVMINELFNTRVTCNQAIVDHPTIATVDGPQVGFLGIVNGIMGRITGARIGAWLDDNERVVGFGTHRQAVQAGLASS